MRSTYLSTEKEEGEETSRGGVSRHAETSTKLKLTSLAKYLTQTIQSTYNNDNNNNRRLPHQIHLRLQQLPLLFTMLLSAIPIMIILNLL